MTDTRQVRQVLLAAVSVSKMNSRKNLEAGAEDAGLIELAESIKANGLIQPSNCWVRLAKSPWPKTLYNSSLPRGKLILTGYYRTLGYR